MGWAAPALWEVLEGFSVGGFQGLRGLGGPCQECQVRPYVAGHCHKPRRLSRRLVVGGKPGGVSWGPTAYLGVCSRCVCVSGPCPQPLGCYW